jgi:hypothetical protein
MPGLTGSGENFGRKTADGTWETAGILDVSTDTVTRDWNFAKSRGRSVTPPRSNPSPRKYVLRG